MPTIGKGCTNFDAVQFDGAADTVNSVVVETYLRDNAGLILMCTGTTVPTDTSSGYAKSAIFLKTDVTTGTGAMYLNKGTTASSQFTLVSQA